jgi:rSAM/selenodomain-associated transferase 1
VAGDRLLVFLKRPRPGEVKTRLVPSLGAEMAAELYRSLAELEMQATAPSGDYERLFFYSPSDARAELAAWLPGQEWRAQRGADLGERMAAAFAEAFELGARRVAIIGSDAPWVSRGLVGEALGALDAADLALVPANDGGYCLLALDRPRPELFTDIPWSTPSVLALTLERAGALGLAVRLLEAQQDIDTLEDLRGCWPRLRPLLSTRPALVASIESALALDVTRLDERNR